MKIELVELYNNYIYEKYKPTSHGGWRDLNRRLLPKTGPDEINIEYNGPDWDGTYETMPLEVLTFCAGHLPRPLAVRIFTDNHPSTPPLVKIWLTTDFGMTLQEFLDAAH